MENTEEIKKSEGGVPTVEKTLQVCLKLIQDLGEKQTKFEAKMGGVILALKQKIEKTKPEEVKSTKAPSLPVVAVPSGVEEAVRTLLGDEVQMSIEPNPGSPTYLLHLTIPQSMSKSPIQPDVRSRTFNYSHGLPDIKEWLQKVRKNLSHAFISAGEQINLP